MAYSSYAHSTLGRSERFDEIESKISTNRIWKKLYSPEHLLVDPNNRYNRIYVHYNPTDLERQQMARRMDRKVIKLETAYGSERQTVVVKRSQDLIVRDLMEEIQRTYRIPIEEQVLFHKGTNLSDFENERLEVLGVENNNTIRVTRDPDLPNRSPRTRQVMYGSNFGQQQQQQYAQPINPVYGRDVSPQRQLDQAPYQAQIYNPQAPNQNAPNDVIKLYVSYGSEREYVLVHGKKPLMIYDMKLELSRVFKIPPDQQCIVFRGFNLHEYLDDAPLEAFGLENNSPISLWPKGANRPDLRLPRGSSPVPQLADMYTPRAQPPLQGWPNMAENQNDVIKLEIQHGSDRHQLILKGQNKTLTVLDLQNELERLTAVPVRDQRLYFKSQELNSTPFKTLKECELENNNAVKLVGEPSRLRYSNYFGRLNVNGMVDPNGNVLQQPQQQQFNQQVQQGYQPSILARGPNFTPQNYGSLGYPSQNFPQNY